MTDNLVKILADLDEIMTDGDYDEDDIKPSEQDADLLRHLLRENASRIPSGGCLYPDGDGGFRFEWSNGDRDLRLVLGKDTNCRYIYHESGGDYAIDTEVTPQTLAKWLDWLRCPADRDTVCD